MYYIIFVKVLNKIINPDVNEADLGSNLNFNNIGTITGPPPIPKNEIKNPITVP